MKRGLKRIMWQKLIIKNDVLTVFDNKIMIKMSDEKQKN